MLINGIEMLSVANKNNFAVPAFNMSSYAQFEATAAACEQLKAPWIAEIHPNEYDHVGPDFVAAILHRALRSTVPMVIHLDHGASYEQVLQAIQDGYTSVMIDASAQPIAENISITQKVVAAAHPVGLSVEAEIGTIGGLDTFGSDAATRPLYTDPDQAANFVSETGCDSLAVAIGTFHGLYPKGMTPTLQLDRLREIKKAVNIPLVLHGGSSNSDKEVAEACRSGINKVNLSSDLKIAYWRVMAQVLAEGNSNLRETHDIEPRCQKALQEVVAHKLELLGTEDKAGLYR